MKKPYKQQNSCEMYKFISSNNIRHPVAKKFTTLQPTTLNPSGRTMAVGYIDQRWGIHSL